MLIQSIALALTLSSLTPLANAEEIRYLARPEQALGAFLNDAENARRSIDLATFIFEPCHVSTRMLLEKIAERASRGVRVRLLLDGLQQKDADKKALLRFAAANGISIRHYNTRELNLRTHIKLMVTDGERYITGGRNISDEYFGLSSENNYMDRDVAVSGSSATQAAQHFNEVWNASQDVTPVGRVAFEGWRSVCKDFVEIEAAQRDFFDSRKLILVGGAPERKCDNVRFTADAPDFASNRYTGETGSATETYMSPARLQRKRTTLMNLNFMRGAKSTLLMENWVYMPVGFLNEEFTDLRARKVQTKVISNADIEDGPALFREAMDYAQAYYADKHSAGTQDVKLISSKGSLKSAHRFTPRNAPTHLHSKIAVRDGKDLLVGSFNLDSRSYNQNLESGVRVWIAQHWPTTHAGDSKNSAQWWREMRAKTSSRPKKSRACSLDYLRR